MSRAGVQAIESCIEDYRNRLDTARDEYGKAKRALAILETDLTHMEQTYQALIGFLGELSTGRFRVG